MLSWSVAPSVIDAVVGSLEDAGPQRLSGVTGRLLAEGLLDDSLLREFALGEIADRPGAEIDRDALAGFVLDELGYDDRVWATVHDDPCLASTDALTGELVLTHRLTPTERDRQAIPVVPDLVALDYRARVGLDLVGGDAARGPRARAGPAGPRRQRPRRPRGMARRVLAGRGDRVPASRRSRHSRARRRAHAR